MKNLVYPNLFKSRYPDLKGKNWLVNVSTEDLQAFIRLEFAHSDYGKLGGKVRSQTAKRDQRGRFIKTL